MLRILVTLLLILGILLILWILSGMRCWIIGWRPMWVVIVWALLIFIILTFTHKKNLPKIIFLIVKTRTLINSRTLRLGRRKKTMGFITADIPLVIPLCGTTSFRLKKPERICSRMETLAINNSAR